MLLYALASLNKLIVRNYLWRVAEKSWKLTPEEMLMN
jgi:hypothetical protein